jgi:ElaB/YqjD/DUF883 family membrane-anchored ribosome-binding protein
MIPQIARRLISRFSKPGPETVVLDPFMGSGGVLVEASLRLPWEKKPDLCGARRSIGIDINPLALLLAKAKTTLIDPEFLQEKAEKLLAKVRNRIEACRQGKLEIDTPYFFNIDYWFKPHVKKELQVIREEIAALEDDALQNFFKACFSKTVREASNTRSREFKLFRMSKKQLAEHNPNVYSIFRTNVNNGLKCMKEYSVARERSDWAQPLILDEDTRSRTTIPERSVDLVVTSPPYGDSRTTVAYGQFSRLSMQWLDIDGRRSRQVDKRSLGGVPTKSLRHSLPSPSLAWTLETIAARDDKRARDVLSYFIDLNKCLREISRVMAPEGKVCIVIGDRSVCGHRIPTGQIIRELGSELGLEHAVTYERRIPTKRMPWENAPSNIRGQKADTIHREQIIVLNSY